MLRITTQNGERFSSYPRISVYILRIDLILGSQHSFGSDSMLWHSILIALQLQVGVRRILRVMIENSQCISTCCCVCECNSVQFEFQTAERNAYDFWLYAIAVFLCLLHVELWYSTQFNVWLTSMMNTHKW